MTRTSRRSTSPIAARWGSPCCPRRQRVAAELRRSGHRHPFQPGRHPQRRGRVVESIIASRTEGEVHQLLGLPGEDRRRRVQQESHRVADQSGAFDSLEHPRKGLFLVHADAVDSVLGTKKAEAMGQFDLFGDMGGGEAAAEVFAVRVPDERWESKHVGPRARDARALRVGPPAGRRRACHFRTDRHVYHQPVGG